MPDYLVEAYDPGAHKAFAVDDPGVGVRHVRSIYVPADESTLHVFAASSLDELRIALERAAFRFERIVEAVTDDDIGREHET